MDPPSATRISDRLRGGCGRPDRAAPVAGSARQRPGPGSGANAIFAVHDRPAGDPRPGRHDLREHIAPIHRRPDAYYHHPRPQPPRQPEPDRGLEFSQIAPGEFNSYYDVPHQGQILVLYVDIVSPIFWGEYDRPFLNDGLSRGDFFIMATSPFDPIMTFSSTGPLTGTPTFLGQEVAYLFGTYDQGVRPPAWPGTSTTPSATSSSWRERRRCRLSML